MAYPRGYLVECPTDSARFGVDIAFGIPSLSTSDREVPFPTYDHARRLADRMDRTGLCGGTHTIRELRLTHGVRMDPALVTAHADACTASLIATAPREGVR